jgi:hypothetical protein
MTRYASFQCTMDSRDMVGMSSTSGQGELGHSTYLSLDTGKSHD